MDLHAYTHLDIKSIDAEQRIITGIASTPAPDRNGHLLDPMGARFASSIPLLLHHDNKMPVGTVTLTASPDGLAFRATVPLVTEPGPLKDRLDETFQAVKAGLLKTVSVGYRVLEGGAERLANGLLRLKKTEICELSLTTVPMNPEAVILSVKSLASECFAAPGIPPAAPSKVKPMTTAEQITTFEADRALRVTALNALQADVEGRTKTEEERAKFAQLQLEIKTFNDELSDLRALEAINASKAQPIVSPAISPIVTPVPVIHTKSNLPPGTSFVRYCKAMAASRGDTARALAHAEQWRDTTPEVELYIKAAVAAATTTDATWAKPLVPSFATIASEFIDLLRPATIIGRIPGLQKVPFNISVPMLTQGGTANWVGEGAPKPVTKFAFGSVQLPMYKMAEIVVFTEELARSSSPAAEDTFRRIMIRDISQFTDVQFIDPAITLIAGVRPASITNGVTGIPATTDPMADLTALLTTFVTAKIPITGVVLIMSATNAFILSASTKVNGDQAFPTLTAGGGTINGVTVIVSETVGTNIVAVVPQYILYADDGGVTIDVSREASLQMSDAPDNPATATTVFSSLWQENKVGLRAERFIAWIKSLPAAVNMITGTAYTP